MREAAVITVSDSSARGERSDITGSAVEKLLKENGYVVTATAIVPDEQKQIRAAILRHCALAELVLTAGGTGIAARDVTPEATSAVCDRLIPGIAEYMRAAGAKNTPLAVLSRGVCGTRGRALILNLPGSPAAAVESLSAVLDILPHALDLLRGHTAHPEIGSAK